MAVVILGQHGAELLMTTAYLPRGRAAPEAKFHQQQLCLDDNGGREPHNRSPTPSHSANATQSVSLVQMQLDEK